MVEWDDLIAMYREYHRKFHITWTFSIFNSIDIEIFNVSNSLFKPIDLRPHGFYGCEEFIIQYPSYKGWKLYDSVLFGTGNNEKSRLQYVYESMYMYMYMSITIYYIYILYYRNNRSHVFFPR